MDLYRVNVPGFFIYHGLFFTHHSCISHRMGKFSTGKNSEKKLSEKLIF